MTEGTNRKRILYPLGVTPEPDGVNILVQARGEEAFLLLYEPGAAEPCEKIAFPREDRMGDVWSMFLQREDFSRLEYQIEVDGRMIADPCARKITGRETWGDENRAGLPVRGCMPEEEFDWEGDKRPMIPYSDTILYRLHVRGFTMHPSSGAAHPGTFLGVAEKIPYLKELGVTSVELMPVAEFDEVMTEPVMPGYSGRTVDAAAFREEKFPKTVSFAQAGKAGAAPESEGTDRGMGTAKEAPEADGAVLEKPDGKKRTEAARSEVPTGRINYWGYGPSYLYAVKAAYGSGKEMSPEAEFKTLVKSLHREGMECIIELYLTGKEGPDEVVQALRYWAAEYHVDGFRLSGFPPVALTGESPFLSDIKLFADNWNEVFSRKPAVGYAAPKSGKAPVTEKHLAEYHSGFQDDMRRVLKGDEGMVQSLAWHLRRNPEDFAVINYMANTNGFTMADMVSYDRKHNEKNGEENRDGMDFNCSWNCGEEGPTKKKRIKKLRWQQLKNAYLLLFLSQGTPLLLAGDEFGNSQEGNNNAYCQDNEISWLDWGLLEANRRQMEFVKRLIAFRKAHPVFHMDREPRLMDYRSCGRPDMSYHGEYAWKPEYESFRRQLGVLYWGPYQMREDGSEDNTFYVAFNMHWEPHMFGLPRLPKGEAWYLVCDTSKDSEEGEALLAAEEPLKNQLLGAAPPRSILILQAGKAGEKEKKKKKRKEQSCDAGKSGNP